MTAGKRSIQSGSGKEDDPVLVIHDAIKKRWLSFQYPYQIITAFHLPDVLPGLRQVEMWIQKGYYAAGFVSYEAAPAFDTALTTREISDFPLLWFGIYRKPEERNLPEDSECEENPDWKSDLDFDRYTRILADVKDYLAAGDTYQVNFSMRLHAEFRGSPWRFFLKLIQNSQTAYGAFVFTGRFSIASASPELFFTRQGNALESRPMKGTRRRGRTLEEDRTIRDALTHSEKDRAENVMIVDMLRNDMGRLAEPGSVRAGSLFSMEKYPTVWQMTSTVSCKTTASVTEIFQALFPCASITGAPKPRTMEIIRKLESTPRKIYTGAIGFITPENRAQFNVAIRTALIDHETDAAEYGVGGGIVWDSDPEQEYQECLNKAAILKENRPDFDILETLLWTPEEGYFLKEYHIRRMCRSAEYFDFTVTEDAIRRVLDDLAGELSGSLKIRLLLDRAGQLKAEIHRIESNVDQEPVRLKFARNPVDKSDPFLYHKTTSRSVYKNAKKERPDCDDVILWNEEAEITETTIFNIVVESEGKRYTPSVNCGLLAGTFREYLLERGEIEEKIIPKEMLKTCERLFCINSVRKWLVGKLVS